MNGDFRDADMLVAGCKEFRKTNIESSRQRKILRMTDRLKSLSTANHRWKSCFRGARHASLSDQRSGN